MGHADTEEVGAVGLAMMIEEDGLVGHTHGSSVKRLYNNGTANICDYPIKSNILPFENLRYHPKQKRESIDLQHFRAKVAPSRIELLSKV